VSIDGTTEGRVIEMNWRATHILTGRRDLAILPNSTIAKSKIVNVSAPSGIHGASVTVAVDGAINPRLGTEILQQAIINCQGIITTPAPSVTVDAISGNATEFGITFFAADFAAAGRAQHELLDLIYRHLTAAGINLAIGANVITPPRDARPRPERVLDIVGIFASLPAAERGAVAAKLTPRAYELDDTVLAPGTTLQSFFIVASGVLSGRRDNGEFEEEVMRFGPGDHFGEIGVLSSAATAAHISALTPAIVYELPKQELIRLLDAYPEVSHAVNRSLARLQETISPPVAAANDDVVPQRLRSRFANWLQRRYDAAMSQ
jgi:CRP-like cAMP-binding protein